MRQDSNRSSAEGVTCAGRGDEKTVIWRDASVRRRGSTYRSARDLAPIQYWLSVAINCLALGGGATRSKFRFLAQSVRASLPCALFRQGVHAEFFRPNARIRFRSRL